MAFLAIDPGLTSGWFLYHTDTNQWEAGEDTFDELAFRLTHLGVNPEAIIVERYTINAETAKKSRQTDALEVTGMCRYCAWLEESEWVNNINPSAAKSLAQDNKLKAIGWWSPGKGHANDAARQMFSHFVKRGYITFMDDLTPVDRLATVNVKAPYYG